MLAEAADSWPAQAGTNLDEPIGQLFFETSWRRAIVFALDAQIVLRGDGIGAVVSIFVAWSLIEPLGAGVVRIAQVSRHGQESPLAHIAARLANGHRRRIGLRRARQIGHGLGQRELTLRQADELASLHRRHGQRQRGRVGVANILAGENHQPPSQKSRLLATFEHSGQPINPRVGIGAANALDQCACAVVVRVAGPIIFHLLALHRLGGQGARDAERSFGA